MTTPTFTDAATATDAPTYRAQALATLAAPPAPLQAAPVAGWSQSAPQRILVDDFATNMAAESALRAKVAAVTSPAGAIAAGASWTAAAISWFDEAFIPALPAVWDVPFTCASASAPLTLDASSVLQIQAASGVILILTLPSAVTFAAGNATPCQALLRFTARLPGTAGNTLGGPGKILTGPAGLSIGGSLPGPTLYTAGRDVETPAAAVRRCLGKWARLGAGWTAQAFDYLIPTSAPTVTRWRVRDDNPYGPGTVGVVLANAAGPATGPEAAAVAASLAGSGVRPLGSGGVTVAAATADPLTVNVTVRGDGTNATLAADVAAAVAALVGIFPLGPATLDNVLLEGIILGGGYSSIKVAAGVEVLTITPSLPGFSGAISITAIDLVAPHAVPTDDVLQLTLNVTVV